MSYVVSIRRDSPITPDELQAAVEGDTDFSVAETGYETTSTSMALRWSGEDAAAPEFFVLEQGTIDITTPSHRALEAAQRLAQKLGAQVIGEEGEDLTDVAVPDEMPGCGPLIWTAVLVAAILAAYWTFA